MEDGNVIGVVIMKNDKNELATVKKTVEDLNYFHKKCGVCGFKKESNGLCSNIDCPLSEPEQMI